MAEKEKREKGLYWKSKDDGSEVYVPFEDPEKAPEVDGDHAGLRGPEHRECRRLLHERMKEVAALEVEVKEAREEARHKYAQGYEMGYAKAEGDIISREEILKAELKKERARFMYEMHMAQAPGSRGHRWEGRGHELSRIKRGAERAYEKLKAEKKKEAEKND